MANCKHCGKPVRAANVFHSACLETVIGNAMQKMCDHYCRFPANPNMSQEELIEKHCNGCPLNELEEELT